MVAYAAEDALVAHAAMVAFATEVAVVAYAPQVPAITHDNAALVRVVHDVDTAAVEGLQGAAAVTLLDNAVGGFLVVL